MADILCYGDSNTWGYDPRTQGRYPRDVRWTGVLRDALGQGYFVIAEGLNGRTTVWEDPIEPPCKCGLDYLLPCLASHAPIDLVILMLGTNDLKLRHSLGAFDIARGAGVLGKEVLRSESGPQGAPPELLLVAPPPLAKLGDFADMFAGGPIKSRRFGVQYAQVAKELGCHFLDADDVVSTSDSDGVHWEPKGHKSFGLAVAERVREILA